jgi:formiminoglutamate deiminase
VTDSTSSHWCELAWLGGDEVAAGVQVDVADGQIIAVRTGAPPPAPGRRRAGLTLPGFANVHSHVFHRALRGRTHAGAGTFWTWRDAMYDAAAALDPESFHRLARATYGEMALAGYVSVGEFHYVHHGPDGRPYADPNAMGEALEAAAADAGVRLTLLDVCYLHGGIGAELTPVQLRFSDGSVGAWAERASARLAPPHVRLGAAVHSVRACTPDEIGDVVRLVDPSAPLHTHVSEQPAENDGCVAAYGRTPTAVLGDAGALGARFTAVHGTHLTDDDIEALSATGSSVCLCPTTERDLADGIGPAGRLAAAGVPLTVGSDSQAVVDGLEEVRAVELDERLASLRRGTFSAADLLRALSADGHRALGWTDAGSLAIGCRADLVTVRLDSVRLAGTEAATALGSVVFAGTAADVTDVTIGGVDVVVAGCHRSIDVPSELASAVGHLAGAIT